MNLYVNLSHLHPPLTGIGHYTYRILQQLQISQQLSSLTGITATQTLQDTALEEYLQKIIQQLVPAEGHNRQNQLSHLLKKLPYTRALRDKYIGYRITQKARKTAQQPNLYWEPNYALVTKKIPAWATIYDHSYQHHPAFHPAERLKWLTTQVPKTLATAQGIFTISEFSRQEIHQHYNYPLDKIQLVPPGLEPAFNKKYSQQEQQTFTQRHNLPNSYLLSVATLEPRKNLNGLLDAYTQLDTSIQQQYPLVIVGAKGWEASHFYKRLQQLHKQGRVQLLGYLPQQEMPLLYAAAKMLIYPSLYEGFGMPVLEAMAQQTPVITSNCSSLPEVAQGAACLVDPHDTAALAQTITELLNNPVLQQQLIQKGLQRSQQYSWENSAQRMLDCWSVNR